MYRPDRDRLGVNQAFLEVGVAQATEREWLLRLERQELHYGTGRMIAAREGPNVRLGFDAVLALNGVTGPDGAPFRGELNYPRQRHTEEVRLEEDHADRLQEIVQSLRALSNQKTPPPRREERSFCRKCAFEELCYG